MMTTRTEESVAALKERNDLLDKEEEEEEEEDEDTDKEKKLYGPASRRTGSLVTEC